MPGGFFRLKKFLGVRTDIPATALRADYRTGETELAPSPNVWADPSGTELKYRSVYVGGAELITNDALPEQALFIPFDDETGAHHQVVVVDHPPAISYGEAGVAILAFPGYDFSYPSPPPSPTINYPTARNRPGWVAWKGKLYLFFGETHPGYVMARGSGGFLGLAAFGSTWPANDRPRARVAWLYRNHLFLAGFDPPDTDTIRNCAVNDPDTLVPANLSFFLRSAGEAASSGGPIVAGIEFPVFGGSTYVEPYSLVWRKRSTWMIQGPPPGPGDTNVALAVTRVIDGEGCIAAETVAATEHGVLWCSEQNVWLAQYGKAPRKVGDAIRPIIAQAAKMHRAAWHGVYHNGIYRLTVPSLRVRAATDGSGWHVTDTEQWWLDLRRFEEAGEFTWWGPMDIPVIASAVEILQGGDKRLVTLTGRKAVEFSTLYSIESTQENGFLPGELFLLSGILNAPDFEVWTKEFDGGDEGLQKLIQSVELHAKKEHIASVFTVDVYGNERAQSVSLVGDVPVTEDALDLDFVMDTSQLGTSFKAASYYPATRFLANTIQVRVRVQGELSGMPSPRLRSIGVGIRPAGRRP